MQWCCAETPPRPSPRAPSTPPPTLQPVMKQLLKPFKPAEDRFEGMDVQVSEATGAGGWVGVHARTGGGGQQRPRSRAHPAAAEVGRSQGASRVPGPSHTQHPSRH